MSPRTPAKNAALLVAAGLAMLMLGIGVGRWLAQAPGDGAPPSATATAGSR